jgi:hypothetical protein
MLLLTSDDGPRASSKFRGLNSTYTTGIDCVEKIFSS